MNPRVHRLDAQDGSLWGAAPWWILFMALVVATFFVITLPLWIALAWWPRTAAGLRASWRWLGWRRECSWCHTRLGGNPLARRVTHGICRPCEARFLEDTAIFNSKFSQGNEGQGNGNLYSTDNHSPDSPFSRAGQPVPLGHGAATSAAADKNTGGPSSATWLKPSRPAREI